MLLYIFSMLRFQMNDSRLLVHLFCFILFIFFTYGKLLHMQIFLIFTFLYFVHVCLFIQFINLLIFSIFL